MSKQIGYLFRRQRSDAAVRREAGRGAFATPSFIPATRIGRLLVFRFVHIIPFALFATRLPTCPISRLEVYLFAYPTKMSHRATRPATGRDARGWKN